MIKRNCTVLITNDQLLLAFFNNSVRCNIEKLEKHLLKGKKKQKRKEKKETAIQYLPRFPVNVRAKFPRISYFKISFEELGAFYKNYIISFHLLNVLRPPRDMCQHQAL